MKKTIRNLAIITSLASPLSFGDGAPSSDIYLDCNPYFVAIGTSLKQKYNNLTNDSIFPGDEVSIAFQALHIGKRLDYLDPYDDYAFVGKAFKDRFTFGFTEKYTLDRLKGTLSRLEDRAQPPSSLNPNYSNLMAIYNATGGREKVNKVKASCKLSTQKNLKSIFDRHNIKAGENKF